MDFVVDSENILVLVNHLNLAADKIDEEVEGIYSLIASLNESWSGESYNLFKEKCEKFRPALESLSDIMRAYSKVFENQISKEEETLEQEIKTAIES